ncbi:hypothetical protein Sjap_021317 [Stephania japonica]|uniref:Uncharacterized protein n=1 Tax=Stephania japonica TaxID=461633 RepID=A0AAP0HU05_9MAGN
MEEIGVSSILAICMQKLSSFSLKDGEKNMLCIPNEKKGSTLEIYKQSILARVASSQTIFKIGLKVAMMKAWHFKGDASFVEVADNIFQIIFDTPGKMNHVDEQGPWIYEDYPFVSQH